MQETPPQAYISKVHLKGYKSIRDLEIDFKPGLNIIIGPNGSGKTNFLEFLDKGFDDSISPDALGFKPYEISFTIEDGIEKSNTILTGFYEDDYDKSIYKELYRIATKDSIIHETLTVYEDNELVDVNTRIDEVNPFKLTPPTFLEFGNPIDDKLGKSFVLKIQFRKNSDKISIVTDRLNPLYDILKNSFNGKFDVNDNYKKALIIDKKFISTLEFHSPIKDLQIDKKIIREYTEDDRLVLDNIFIQFNVNNKWLYWNQLSDGTKRIFYLITKVFHSKNYSPIFLEEPELGIHPNQLYKLMDFLKEQSKEKQIIITTHSPEVLNILKQDEVDRIIVTRHEGEKGTKMYHLSEKEQGHVRNYMKHEASISDYWLQSGFEKENEEEVAP